MSLPAGRPALTLRSSSVRTLGQRLIESLRLRVLHVPRPPEVEEGSNTRIAILFSGGLDCTVLARLSHGLVSRDHGIDLINVAFENPRVVASLQNQDGAPPNDIYEVCPDRITGRKSFAELLKVCPGRAWRFVAVRIGLHVIAHAHIASGQRPVYRDCGCPRRSGFVDVSAQHGDGPLHSLRALLCRPR